LISSDLFVKYKFSLQRGGREGGGGEKKDLEISPLGKKSSTREGKNGVAASTAGKFERGEGGEKKKKKRRVISSPTVINVKPVAQEEVAPTCFTPFFTS